MSTRTLNTLAIVVALAALASSLVGCGKKEGTVIRIGLTAPLTGPCAEGGIATKQAVELAADEWNKNGGINIGGKKYTIQVIAEDTQSKPEVGVSVAEKLITRDRVHFLFGDAYNSSVSLAIMELAPKYELPMSTVQCDSKEISDKIRQNPKKYARFFKGGADSDQYGRADANGLLDLVKKNKIPAKSKTVAFLVEDTDYGRSVKDDCAVVFQEQGWKILSETVPLGHTDFYPQLSKLKSSEPDIVLTCFTSLASGVALTKQYHEVGLAAALLIHGVPVEIEFLEQAGEACEGLLWAPLYFDPNTIPAHKEFADKIAAKFNAIPRSDHAWAYDMMNNALTAMKTAGSLEPQKIVDAYAKTDRKGVLCRWAFGADDHTIKVGEGYFEIAIGQVINGKSFIVWPDTLKQKDYVQPSWVK